MLGQTKKFQTYAEFWPFYLSQHAKRITRLIHVLGTLSALFTFIMALICLSPLWFLLALLIGYGFAWFAHAVTEKNHPATFTYPLWSLRGDFDMLWLWLSGQLEAELIRHNITS